MKNTFLALLLSAVLHTANAEEQNWVVVDNSENSRIVATEKIDIVGPYSQNGKSRTLLKAKFQGFDSKSGPGGIFTAIVIAEECVLEPKGLLVAEYAEGKQVPFQWNRGGTTQVDTIADYLCVRAIQYESFKHSRVQPTRR